MTVKLHPNCTEKAFDGTVCSARLQEVRGGLTRKADTAHHARLVVSPDSINSQDASFTMRAELCSISRRTVRAHGKHTARRPTAYFAKNSRSSCVPRGFLHGGDDLVGSWIENEILARHE